MTDRYRMRPREEITVGARFTRAMDGFVAALDAPDRQFSGRTLVDSFLDVEHALFLLRDIPEDSKDDLRFGLAGRGARVSEERRYPGTAVQMRGFQERIQDARAIRHGEYEFVRVQRDHGEQHGAPDSTREIYRRPDGQEVSGQSTSVREGRGIYGGIIDLYPGEVSGALSPFRRLPPRPEPRP